MASKRVSVKAIEWAKLAERVPVADKPKLIAFRAKSDSYLRRMLANPETPPKIDWALYKKTVPIPGMVDTFQKQYESMQIPIPQDTASSQIDKQEVEIKKWIQDFKAGSNQRIQAAKEEISRINSLLPYDQMTMEDFLDAHPEEKFDPINNPTLWPHNPEDQLNHKEENAPSSSH